MLEVIDSLANAFIGTCVSGDIQQSLICFSILNDSLCLPIHRQYNWTLGLLELF